MGKRAAVNITSPCSTGDWLLELDRARSKWRKKLSKGVLAPTPSTDFGTRDFKLKGCLRQTQYFSKLHDSTPTFLFQFSVESDLNFKWNKSADHLVVDMNY